jgi:ribonuclease BN (tRNA processing enzyme)
MVLDAQFRHRQRPLVVAGPPGVQERAVQAMDVLFPGSPGSQRAFDLHFLELTEREPTQVSGFRVTAFPVAHASGAPAYALRLSRGTKTIAYSGDTAWTPTLVDVAVGRTCSSARRICSIRWSATT